MKDKNIVIIGGGGHVKVLIDAILSGGRYKIEGILDDKLKTEGVVMGYMGFPILGGDEILERFKDFYLALGIGSVKANDKRKTIYEKFKIMGFEFPTIIHSNACISNSAVIEDGVQIMAGVIISPDAKIGANTLLNTSALVEHDCVVGPHCHISLKAILGGGVKIGESSHIGMGANILQGVEIGNRVTVGAGAVVTKDVADDKTVVGIPAREMIR